MPVTTITTPKSFTEFLTPSDTWICAEVIRPLGGSGRTYLVNSVLCFPGYRLDNVRDSTSLRVIKIAAKSDREATCSIFREHAAYQELRHLQGVFIPELSRKELYGVTSNGPHPIEYWCLEMEYCRPNVNFVKDSLKFKLKERFLAGIRAIHAAGYTYDREFDVSHIVVHGASPRLVGLADICGNHNCPEIVWNGPDGQPILPKERCCELVMIENVMDVEEQQAAETGLKVAPEVVAATPEVPAAA